MSVEQEKNYDNYRLEKYLTLIYKGLAGSCEITPKRGEIGDGFFGGFDLCSGNALFYNYCKLGNEKIQKKSKINLKNLKYFVIKRINGSEKLEDNKEMVNKHLITNKKLSFSIIKENPKNLKNNINLKKPQNEYINTFMTDKAISKKNKTNSNLTKKQIHQNNNQPKKFQKWVPKNIKEEDLDFNLEKHTKFNQFSENAKLNNFAEDFNIEEYTTKLDLNNFSKKEIEEAKKVEKEIISGKHLNFINRHILEERGLLNLKDNDEDEEKLYSAVDMPIPKIKPKFLKKSDEKKNLGKFLKEGFLKIKRNNKVNKKEERKILNNNIYYNRNDTFQNINYYNYQYYNMNYNNLIPQNSNYFYPGQNQVKDKNNNMALPPKKN